MGKSYYRWMFLLYWAALAICGALRIYLRFAGIDLATGLYLEEGPLTMAFNGILAVAVIAMLAMNRLHITDHDYPMVNEGRRLGFLCVLLAVSQVLMVLEDLGWLNAIPHNSIQLEGGKLWVCSILGFASALCFLWLGVRGLVGATDMPSGVVTICPAIWMVVSIVVKFNRYTTLTTLSDNLLTVLFMVFSSLFLIGHARTLCGFARRDGRNYALSMGLVSSLLGFLLTVPSYAYILVKRAAMPALELGYSEALFILLLSLYALFSSVSLRRSIALV